MLSVLSRSSKQPLLFDIRIRNTDNLDDVLLIKGSPERASSVLLSGFIVFSVIEPIQVKNLSLRLNGKLLLNLPSNVTSTNSPLQRFVKYEKIFFNHNWDNFNVETYFDNLYENYGTKIAIASKSSTNLTGLQKKRARSKSNSSILSLSSNTTKYRTLVKGNYEIPFSAILPGSLTESLEGFTNAVVTYKLQATMECHKSPDLICKKHLRVVRTLSPDAVELSESTAIDNSWPKKVEYSISIPAKAIAIGSATPIDISFVPLLKGLKLGPIKIQLIETIQCYASSRGSSNNDRIITKLKLKDPLGHVKQLKLRKRQIEESGQHLEDIIPRDESFQDRWEFETILNVPPSLSKCSQDASILSNIKVRHKIKFVISLINPDGHISELRASLPIQLFISPFVAVSCKSPETIDKITRNFGKPVPINPKHEDLSIGSTRESIASYSPTTSDSDTASVLFGKNYSEVELQAETLQNNLAAPLVVSELMTPPNYGRHVYDRLYLHDNSNNTTPRSSTPGTPREESIPNNVNCTPTDMWGQPLENNQHTMHQSSSGSPGDDIFTFENLNYASPDAGISTRIDFPSSPMPTPTVEFISRENSFVTDLFPSSQSVHNGWERSSLSRVPSYDKALQTDITGEDLPPSYTKQNSNHNVRHSLERPQNLRHRSTSLLAIPSGRQRSHSFLSRSNNNSSSSLHGMAGHDIPARISTPDSIQSKNSSSSKHFSINMTPVMAARSAFDDSDQNKDNNYLQIQPVQPQVISRLRGSSITQKTASFGNFLDFFARKES